MLPPAGRDATWVAQRIELSRRRENLRSGRTYLRRSVVTLRFRYQRVKLLVGETAQAIHLHRPSTGAAHLTALRQRLLHKLEVELHHALKRSRVLRQDLAVALRKPLDVAER